METQLSQQHPPCQNLSAPRYLAFKTHCQAACVWAYQTLFAPAESTTTEGTQVAEAYKRPTPLQTQQQNDRDRNTRITGNSLRVQIFPGRRFPAKFGCQPIKLQLYPPVHTYPANNVRVHFRHRGVYKESRVAYRATWVRVS